jgi:trigger factor
MVLKKFEPDILAEVKRRLVPDIYRKALKENKLSAVGYPEIEEVQFGKGVPLMFNATVEIAPDFSLPEYKGLAARAARNEVSEEDVEKALGILRDRQAKYETVDREAKEGDIAVVNYTGTCEGKPIIETAPTAKGLTEQKNFWVNIAKDSFIPGFSEQLVGAKKGAMAEVADHVIVVNETHYGRAEDAQMGICHMLCYAFMENPEIAR